MHELPVHVGGALVAALVMGRFLFGESVTPRKVAAILLMALGVALVVR